MNTELTPQEMYDRDGFFLARGLFSSAETARLLDHYAGLHAANDPAFEGGIDMESADPLRRYPRLMQPHRTDPLSFDWMLDPRIADGLTRVLGASPFAVQTMVYFKPPGARGQALHQDQRYLQVRPGTCAAAWLALDPCDEANGCLEVVPGSHKLPLLCPIKSDTGKSFTSETVPVPPGLEVRSIPMEPGDVLFFHGNLIHGSQPNTTADRFRRIIAGHYIVAEAQSVARWYDPVYRLDGTRIEFDFNDGGGSCGTYVAGDLVINQTIEEALAAH